MLTHHTPMVFLAVDTLTAVPCFTALAVVSCDINQVVHQSAFSSCLMVCSDTTQIQYLV